MIGLKKILYPTDFSRCARQAQDHALYLAGQFKAELYMLHAIVLLEDDPHNPAHHFPDPGEIHERLKTLASAKMTEALESHGKQDVRIVMEQERGISPAEVILEYAAKKDVDLVVMGTHGRRGLGHLFLGSVAEEVVRFSPCPVLTIRERKEPGQVHMVERILAPVDFSDHAKSAVSNAKEIAATYGAKVDLLHVIEEVVHPTFYGTGATSIVELRPTIIPKSKEVMERIFREAPGPEVEAEYHVVEGRASGDIIKFAEDHRSDLIVIATHGLSSVEHLLLGSVTEKVVRQAPCPVFTVKAFGKSLIK